MPYLGNFGESFEYSIVIFEINTLKFVTVKFHLMRYLRNFRSEFEKTIVTFEINSLKFAKMQSFM